MKKKDQACVFFLSQMTGLSTDNWLCVLLWLHAHKKPNEHSPRQLRGQRQVCRAWNDLIGTRDDLWCEILNSKELKASHFHSWVGDFAFFWGTTLCLEHTEHLTLITWENHVKRDVGFKWLGDPDHPEVRVCHYQPYSNDLADLHDPGFLDFQFLLISPCPLCFTLSLLQLWRLRHYGEALDFYDGDDWVLECRVESAARVTVCRPDGRLRLVLKCTGDLSVFSDQDTFCDQINLHRQHFLPRLSRLAGPQIIEAAPTPLLTMFDVVDSLHLLNEDHEAHLTSVIRANDCFPSSSETYSTLNQQTDPLLLESIYLLTPSLHKDCVLLRVFRNSSPNSNWVKTDYLKLEFTFGHHVVSYICREVKFNFAVQIVPIWLTFTDLILLVFSRHAAHQLVYRIFVSFDSPKKK